MERLLAFFRGRNDYPPNIRMFLREFGAFPIQSIKVCRTPIQSAINIALNLLSLGEFDKKKKELNYDQLYHLFLSLTILDPKSQVQSLVKCEKNEVINIGFSSDTGDQNLQVPFSQSISLQQFLDNGKNFQTSGQLGAKFSKDYFSYDPANNNCQIFIMTLLKANNLMTPEIEQFVFQDAQNLLTGTTRTIASAVTTLGNRFNILIHGAARKYQMKTKGKRKKVYVRRLYVKKA